jgi:hypothetical protein
VVFRQADGSGPVLPEHEVEELLTYANRRLAQAAMRVKYGKIDMGPDGRGVEIKPETAVLSNGFTPSSVVLGQGRDPTDDEKAIITYKDSDQNTVDVFIVNQINHIEFPFAAAYMSRYNKMINPNGTRNTAYQNFIVIQRDLSAPAKQQVVGHELMHVLLNVEHREDKASTQDTEFADPVTSLFYESPTTDWNDRLVAKRIGPFPDLGGGFMGEDDTRGIRSVAEGLPVQ